MMICSLRLHIIMKVMTLVCRCELFAKALSLSDPMTVIVRKRRQAVNDGEKPFACDGCELVTRTAMLYAMFIAVY